MTSSRTVRIVSWNTDGILPHLEGLPGWADRLAPDVLCLQELRVRAVDEPLVRKLEGALPGYHCGLSLARDPRNVTFRGGRMYGVATFTKKRLRAAHRAVGWDLEGRVVVSELGGLAIVNVYAVNGTAKPYYDHALGRVNGDRHAFKRRFNQQLADECAALRARGLELVVIGDFNISRTRLDTWPRLRTEEPHALARRTFNEELMPRLDLVDVFRELHPETRKYTWFNRRARGGRLDAARVDFALVSRSLMPRVLDADIDERPDARGRSDHAPLWVTLRR